MNRTLDIDLLRTFQAVARLGQFRAAAEHLNKTQSAVSMQIRRLEGSVGERLLFRNNQGIALTPSGERLLQQACELVAVHDRILKDFGRQSLSGQLRLGLPDEYACTFVSGMLTLFKEVHSEVVLEIVTAPSGALIDDVNAGRLDLAIVIQPEAMNAGTVLWRTAPVWAGATSAPAIARRDPVPLALHTESCPYRRLALDALQKIGRRWYPAVVTSNVTVIETAVEVGLAIAVMDRARLTSPMTVVNGQEGLPELAPHAATLLRTPKSENALTETMAKMIVRRFARRA